MKRAIFRPVQYLGSKVRALDDIVSVVQDVAAEASCAVDLFSGTSVVAQAFAKNGYQTTAVDTQTYAAVFARALLGISRQDGERIDGDSIVAQATKVPISEKWRNLSEREHQLMDADDAYGMRELQARLPLVWRQGGYVAENDAPLTSFYSGTYFGIEQALKLDALACVIRSPEHGWSGTWSEAAAMTALLSTASTVVHSAGKHFAQPFKPRPSNSNFHDRRLLSDRSIDVYATFKDACVAINEAAPPSCNGHRSIAAEAETYVSRSTKHGNVYYLDPPYTAQQYSRFYHILETIATGAVPSIPNGNPISSGLYPKGRYKSAFSSRRRAPNAFKEVVQRLSDISAYAIISYSISRPGSTGNVRMITLDEMMAMCSRAFGHHRMEVVELTHRYRQFNGTSLSRTTRDDGEVLIVCKPD